MAYLFDLGLNIYMVVIIFRVIFSWIPPRRPTHFHLFIYKVTEPVLQPIRQIIPPIGGTIDVSPIIIFLIIGVIKRFMPM